MSLKDRLFSFEGRIRRRDWWLWTVCMILISWIASQIVAPMAFGEGGRVEVNPADPFNVVYPTPLLVLMLIVGALMTWPNLAMAVKRRHDRDKSGKLILVLLVIGLLLSWAALMVMAMGVRGPWLWVSLAYNMPVGIYMYVVLGFLDGTPGPNRYGASPKGDGGGGSLADEFA